MPSAVATPVRTDPRRVQTAFLVIATAVMGMLVTWSMLELTRSPDVVPRLTIVNPTPVDLEVDVARRPGGAVVGLGPVPAGSERVVRDVIDQGDRWVFGVDSAVGRLAGVVVERARLTQDGWTVELPDDLGRRVAAMRSGP
jgi:hypothetical protein